LIARSIISSILPCERLYGNILYSRSRDTKYPDDLKYLKSSFFNSFLCSSVMWYFFPFDSLFLLFFILKYFSYWSISSLHTSCIKHSFRW
jgi:hypothetical protein